MSFESMQEELLRLLCLALLAAIGANLVVIVWLLGQ